LDKDQQAGRGTPELAHVVCGSTGSFCLGETSRVSDCRRGKPQNGHLRVSTVCQQQYFENKPLRFCLILL